MTELDIIQARRLIADRSRPGWGQRLEEIIRDWYEKIVTPGSVVLDGGANAGIHTYPLARLVGEKGKVVAVEALPDHAKALAEGAASRGLSNVEVHCGALWSAAGQRVTFHQMKSSGYSGIKPTPWSRGIEEEAAFDVSTTTIDQLVGHLDQCGFIKLDLEGAEFSALLGARRVLERHRPVVVSECGRAGAASTYGFTEDEYFGLWAELKYQVFDVLGEPELGNWATPRPAAVPDLILVPEEHELMSRFDECATEIVLRRAADLPT